MKNIIYITLSCLLLFVIYSCNKTQTDFKKFQGDKEIIYTGAVGQVISEPGNLRVGLKWKSSSDPSIVKYVIYWNNKADSQVVNIDTKTDSIETIIPGLQEFVYSFTIFSYDAKGNKSIATEVNNVKVYGSIYQSTLLNRAYNATSPYSITDAGDLRLNFIAPDTINLGTTITYTKNSGGTAEAILSADSTSITLPGYKPGTDISYLSSFIPERGAIDVFVVSKPSSFPPVDGIVQCDKSLFQKHTLPNDMGLLQSDTDVDHLWKGDPTTPHAYANIFHSDANDVLPRTLTFDLGKIYKRLVQVEEVGRDCCNNPNDFEIWGIADITNATTNLKSNDPGWPAEAVAKGWTLLKEVKRNDNGNAAFKTDLNTGLPPVRYIRIRVLSDANGETRYVNLSQVTFWANLLNL